MKPLILIGSEDVDYYMLLSHILAVDGFTPQLADGLDELVRAAADDAPQAIVLDCRAGSFGAAACARLKQDPATSEIPVVALIAPGAHAQHVDLIKARIDESFTRPVAPAKLLDFLRASLLERHPVGDGERLACGDLEMEPATYRVRRAGHDVHLGPIEFRLLRHLLQHPGQVFSRDELIGAAWPENIHVEARTVDVHIGRLRRTLKSAAGTDPIRTVRSAGYALATSPADEMQD